MEKIYPSNKESLDEIKADKETISDLTDRLRIAIDRGDEEDIKKILKQGVSIYESFQVGPMVDSLSLAIQLDKPKLVDFFIKKSQEQEGNIEYLSSKLLEAVKQEKPEIVKKLLEKGANVNYESNNGDSPIFSAIENENSEILEILIDKGAHINTLDVYGQTLIDYVISNSYSEDMDSVTESENLDFVPSNENKKCIELLIKKTLEKDFDPRIRESLDRLNQPGILRCFKDIDFMATTDISKIPYQNKTSLYDLLLCDPTSDRFSEFAHYIDIDKCAGLLKKHEKELGLYAPKLNEMYMRVYQKKQAEERHIQHFIKGYPDSSLLRSGCNAINSKKEVQQLVKKDSFKRSKKSSILKNK